MGWRGQKTAWFGNGCDGHSQPRANFVPLEIAVDRHQLKEEGGIDIRICSHIRIRICVKKTGRRAFASCSLRFLHPISPMGQQLRNNVGMIQTYEAHESVSQADRS